MATVHALREPDPRPGITQSIDRLVDAAQGLATDQVGLWRLEAEGLLVRVGLGGLAVLLGSLVMISGWVAGLCALHLVLTRWLEPAASLGLLSGVTLALGAAVALGGARRLVGS